MFKGCCWCNGWDCFNAGTGLETWIFSLAGICSKAETGVKAGTGSDAGIQENNSLGNPTKTVYPVMMNNITIPLITIFCLLF